GLHADIEVAGSTRGQLSVFYVEDRPFLLPYEQNLVNGVATILSHWLESKRAEAERQKTLHRQQGISLLAQSLLAKGPLEGKLKTITDSIVRLFDADFCRVWLIRPGDFCERGCVHAEVHDGPHVCRYRDRCLHLLASSGRYTHTDGKGHRRVPFGCYKIGRVASGQEHKFLTNDAVNDPRVHNHQWARELGLVAFAGYQLRAPGGETLGVLALFAKHAISPEEDAMLDGLSSAVALVAQQAAAEEALQQANVRLEELATTDALTGLANRRRFMEALEAEFRRSRRYGTRLALAMVDVDRFKSFNDAHGHAFGDRVIVEVAKRLASEARQTDVVARLGGDEFVMLMPETSADEAVRAAERIRKAVSKDPISDGERSVPATVSVGIATVADGKAGTPENLLKQADDAMYAAKEAGRNRVCLAPSEKAVSPAQ
ncbi:MAG: sensor domain-containing diguanylate cyclase, partial [Planctomycetota bacterium]|nr:sensor domain-containing diguanylate cyclase [Planctomycetota bacterium]